MRNSYTTVGFASRMTPFGVGRGKKKITAKHPKGVILSEVELSDGLVRPKAKLLNYNNFGIHYGVSEAFLR